MTEIPASGGDAGAIDVADYCREVEEHLARVNEGQLIRIVGAGFDLVRSWALEGIPLSVVCRGISAKSERHRLGRSKRPLRLEFCADDVQAVYDGWRRAVGLARETSGAAADPSGAPHDEPRRGPLGKHLERVIDALSRAAGRLDLPDAFRDGLNPLLDDLVRLRDEARKARGAERETLIGRLPAIDSALLEAARAAVGADVRDRLRADAATELAAYRSRLTSESWQRAVTLGTDRLLREWLRLPTVTFE